MKRAFYAFIISLGISLPTSSFAGLAGTYRCAGTDPFHQSRYQNIPLVIKQTGNTYQLRWDFGQQDGMILGIGTVNSSAPTVFSAVFWGAKNTANIGIITYYMRDSNTLDGNWTVPNRTQVGTETCKRE